MGRDTPVNAAIRDTLAERPDHFQYLNNGVTALCEIIDPKNGTAMQDCAYRVDYHGAQTVASTAGFVADNPDPDISGAKVMITLITADADGDSKSVTRARNHQNPVQLETLPHLTMR
ncbi:MAG: AIPR family protein [Sphingomonadales bacterium]|nr:AIPR family protein [Sphingomonadales bacterium]